MRKVFSIALLALVLLFLFVDWVKYEPVPIEELFEDLAETGTLTAVQQETIMPQEQINALSQAMKTGTSPHELSQFLGFLGQTMWKWPYQTDEMRVMMWVLPALQALFWVIVALLVKLMMQHLFGRRPRGVPTFLLIILLLYAPLLFMAAGIRADMGPGVFLPTPVAHLAVVAMLASCILWQIELRTVGARKGKWTLHAVNTCPRCGMAQTERGNMFCEQCGNILEEEGKTDIMQ